MARVLTVSVWVAWANITLLVAMTLVAGPATADTAVGVDEQRLVEALDSAGFAVQKGRFAYFQIKDCEKLESCFGNNPSSPYGLFYLPPPPGQEWKGHTPLQTSDGLRPGWALAEHEAVLFVGRTPPDCRYFGFRSYLMERWATLRRRPIKVFGSLADSINHRNIKLHHGTEGPFESLTSVVSTASALVAETVAAAIGPLVGAETINIDVIPHRLVKLGLQDRADTISMLARVAGFADAKKGQEYLDSPPAYVLRLTPRVEIPSKKLRLFDTPALKHRGQGQAETDRDPMLAGRLRQLAQAVVKEYSSEFKHKWHTVVPVPLVGQYCARANLPCNGDNSDTTYQASMPSRLGTEEFVVMVGVNHHAVGYAEYSNIAFYNKDRLMGISGVLDDGLVGSAKAYLADAEDDLYAWVIARDCTGVARQFARGGYRRSNCYQMPYEFPGLKDDERMMLMARAYLTPGEDVGPSWQEISRFEVYHFYKAT